MKYLSGKGKVRKYSSVCHKVVGGVVAYVGSGHVLFECKVHILEQEMRNEMTKGFHISTSYVLREEELEKSQTPTNSSTFYQDDKLAKAKESPV